MKIADTALQTESFPANDQDIFFIQLGSIPHLRGEFVFFVFSIFASGSFTSRARADVIPRCTASGIDCSEAKILLIVPPYFFCIHNHFIGKLIFFFISPQKFVKTPMNRNAYYRFCELFSWFCYIKRFFLPNKLMPKKK